MKKHLLLLLTLLTVAGAAKAQEATTDSAASPKERTRHFALGVLGGMDRNYHTVDMAYMTEFKYDKYSPGYTFGIQATYAPLKWFSLRTDVVMVQKNYHMDHVLPQQRINTNTTTENNYLNVPVTLRLSLGRAFRVHVFGGGYVGYWLSSRRYGVSYSMSHEEDADKFDEVRPFNEVRDNRFDAGLVYGAGISGIIIKKIEVGAEVRWFYGLTDIQNNYMRHQSPRYNTTFVIQGGVSYWL